MAVIDTLSRGKITCWGDYCSEIYESVYTSIHIQHVCTSPYGVFIVEYGRIMCGVSNFGHQGQSILNLLSRKISQITSNNIIIYQSSSIFWFESTNKIFSEEPKETASELGSYRLVWPGRLPILAWNSYSSHIVTRQYQFQFTKVKVAMASIVSNENSISFSFRVPFKC